jgi:hypothetical protein
MALGDGASLVSCTSWVSPCLQVEDGAVVQTDQASLWGDEGEGGVIGFG